MKKTEKKIKIRIISVILVLQLICSCTSHTEFDKQKQTIICVGDSITYGYGILDKSRFSYPSILYRLFDEKYNVLNMGINGLTVSFSGNKSIHESNILNELSNIQVDYLILMLGTNDSKQINWIDNDYFRNEYINLIDTIRMQTDATIITVLPIHAYQNRFGIDNNIIQEEVIPIILETSKIEKIHNIDTRDLFWDSTLLIDGVHPGKKGYSIIAETIYINLINVYHM